MTFIASVVAKKGVAIIADSLVTSSAPILRYRSFLDYLNAQPKNAAGEISVDPAEIAQLFQYEPIYTKDFEEKIFKLNNYTAITTTGIASINEKKIIDLVHQFVISQPNIEDFAIPIEEKIDAFKQFVESELREHVKKFSYVGQCIFIITFYEKSTSTTHIYKLTTREANTTTIADPNAVLSDLYKEMDWVKVVCDGQNKLSDNILYGHGREFYTIFPSVVNNILAKLSLPAGTVPDDFVDQLLKEPFFEEIFYKDLELTNLSELSLQQAVDLASLLMRLEVDFQKYTRDVPTVGGVIKLAVIGEFGFKFISGHEIVPPKHIIL